MYPLVVMKHDGWIGWMSKWAAWAMRIYVPRTGLHLLGFA